MATTSLIIGVDYLKENTPLDDNIDSDIILPIIANAQDKYILPIVGTGIYDEITSEIAGGTLSGDNQTLVDTYLTPVLKEYALYEVMPFIHLQLTNKGLLNKSSESSEPVDLDEFYMLNRRVKDTGEYYAERAIRYLEANTDKFPLYSNPGDGWDTVIPVRSQYFSGISIPERGGHCWKTYDHPRYRVNRLRF